MIALNVVILVLSIVAFALWYYRTLGRRAYYLRNFPGVPAHPLIGNSNIFMTGLSVRKNVSVLALQFMTGLAKHIYKKEGLFVFWQGLNPVINLYTPETVEVIFSSNVEIEKSFSYKYLHPWLGTGLLTSAGSKWKARRKLLTPTFHFRILDDFIPIFNDHSMKLVKILEDKLETSIDIMHYTTNCTLDIICETAMGVKVNAQNNPESDYVKAIYSLGEIFAYRNTHFLGWFDFIFYRIPQGRQYLRNLNILHGFTRQVIQERIQEIVRNKANVTPIDDELAFGQKKRLAFLDLLVEQHLSNSKISEEGIREEVDTFMFEGHDTTAIGISWTLYLLGLYPDIQSKIHNELDSIYGSDRSRFVRHEDLTQLKYLECCVKESLRLFPSVPAIARVINNDIHINNYMIPKGATVAINTFGLHRHEHSFPNPEHFNPDRFLPENLAGLHPYAYVPFSAGPRNCIGQRFALTEEKIVIANVLRNYELKSLDQRDKLIIGLELLTRPKHALRLILKSR